MSVLRSTTFQLQIKTGDGETRLRSFTRSVSDADKTVAKLNEELGENVTATYKTVQSTKELTAQARMHVTQIEKANRSYASQTEIMNHQLNLIGKSEAEQASLNAQFKLGASATDEQRKSLGDLAKQLSLVQQEEAQVNAASEERIRNEKLLSAANTKQAKKNESLISQYTRLNKLMTEYGGDVQKVNAMMQLGSNATKEQVTQLNNLIDANRDLKGVQAQTQGSFRGLRGQAQNFGWQMQDIAVQMQMGTDKMVIFSQQGSQLASGFGPWGAVAGAVIAVGGALAGVIFNTKELAEAQEITKVTTKGLTDRLYEQAKAGKALTEEQKQLVVLLQEEKINNYAKSIKKLTKEHDEQNGVTKKLNEQYQLNKDVVSSAAAIDKEKITSGYALTAMLSNEQKEAIGSLVTKEKVEKANKAALLTANKLTQQKQLLELAEKNLQHTLKGTKFETDESDDLASNKIESAFTAQYNSLIKQTETINQEYVRRKKSIDDYNTQTGADHEKASEAYALLEKWKTNELGKEAIKRAKIVEGANSKEARRIQKILDEANKRTGKGALTDPRLIEEQRFNDTLKPLIEERDRLQSWEYEKRKRIDGLMERENERHAKAMTEAQVQQAATIIGAVGMTSSMMSSTIDLMSTGAEDIESQMENMNNAQKAMFLVTQGVAAAEAIINGISLGMKLAEIFPLAAVPMLTFGTTLGVAQAGVIAGTTFAGAFDAGGVIPAGQKGIVSEYGDELVGGTMVYNNSSSGLGVTGREDTAKLMNGGGIQFNINNNASGLVDVSGTQVDEKTIDLKIEQHFAKNIDAGVAGVIGKPSSKTSKMYNKSYRASRKVR